MSDEFEDAEELTAEEVAELFDKIERVEFDLGEGSMSIVLLEYDGEQVLVHNPGGVLTVFGQPVDKEELVAVLRERFAH